MFQSARSRAEFVVHFHVENVGHLVEKRGKLHHGVGVLLEGQIEEVRVLEDKARFCDRVVRVLEGNGCLGERQRFGEGAVSGKALEDLRAGSFFGMEGNAAGRVALLLKFHQFRPCFPSGKPPCRRLFIGFKLMQHRQYLCRFRSRLKHGFDIAAGKFLIPVGDIGGGIRFRHGQRYLLQSAPGE